MRPAAAGPDLAELAAAAILVAEFLDDHGSMYSGQVRQLAQTASTLAAAVAAHRCAATPPPADPAACAACGDRIEQSGRGRPRRYCVTCSPRRLRGKS